MGEWGTQEHSVALDPRTDSPPAAVNIEDGTVEARK